MYDDDELLKKKRRNLIIIIVVIILLIGALAFYVITREPGSLFGNGMSCTLKVIEGDKNPEGNYVAPITVGFDQVKGNVTKKVVGTSESEATSDTYIVNKSGTVTVKGFIYNSKNEVQTCSLPVSVAQTSGRCVLEAVGGTKGADNWYLSDVSIKLTTLDTGDLTITKYYVHEKHSEVPDANSDTYTVKNDGTTVLEGVVNYSNGKSTTCALEVKKDATKPTCTMNITGTKNSKGQYTTNATITIKSSTDATSGVATSGFGTETEHNDQEYIVSDNGTHNVVGYVKDKAGNIGSCSMSVTKVNPSSGGGSSKPSTPTTIVKSNKKMCKLRVTGAQSNGVYTQAVVVSFAELNDGIASTNILVGNKAGSDVVYITDVQSKQSFHAVGKVTYSNNQTVTCTQDFTIDPTQDTIRYFLTHAKVGDKVNYSAGKWSKSASVSGDASFGGYSNGASKDASVKCASGDYGSNSGWRVFMVNGTKVYLIHAGVPICFNHTATTYYTALNALNTASNASHFVNKGYASSARYMTWSDYGFLSSNKAELLATGSTYYLAGANSDSGYSSSFLRQYYPNDLWAYVSSSAHHTHLNGTHGARPIVLLNSNVGATYSGGTWKLTVVSKSLLDDDEDDTMHKEFFDDTLTILINSRV